jgi:hypothetical protein
MKLTHLPRPLFITLSLVISSFTSLSAQPCADWGNFKTTIKEGNKVNIWWENNETRQTFAYEIEASYDGRKFERIGTLTGLQNYEGATPYSFDHEKPFLGNNFYRLKRIMTNKDSCYSPTLSMFLNANGIQAAEMFPNPVHDYLKISFFCARFDTIFLAFYDAAGFLSIQERLPTTIGRNVLYYNVENIENGVYSVELKNKEVAVRHRIVVLH